MPADGAPAVFYDRAAWYTVKQSDLADFEMVQVLPGNGGKFATSAGAIEVMQKTPAGAPRAGPVVDFDPDKNQSNEAIAAMQMA